MKAVSYYHRETGIFRDLHLIASDEAMIERNRPTDHVPIEGHFDHLSKKVDTGALSRLGEMRAELAALSVDGASATSATAQTVRDYKAQLEASIEELQSKIVVDHQPPRPSDDHEWNEQTKRWTWKPEIVRARHERSAAQSAITAAEQQSLRALRELLLELAAKIGHDTPAAALVRKADAEIASHRTRLGGAKAAPDATGVSA